MPSDLPPADPPAADPAARRHPRLAVAWGVALAGLALDQLTKAWALANLTATPQPLIGDLIRLRLVFNPGAAFSLGESVTWLYTAVAALVTIGLVITLPRITERRWLLTLSVLLAGAAGNLTDRLVREPGFGRGHVVDFIDYGPFVGNVADIFIVGAALALAGLSLAGVPARTTAADLFRTGPKAGPADPVEPVEGDRPGGGQR